ncbi:MAG TPA: 4-hydroxy-3-methylbut-2-enyl diphosphate reductase, partial [Thermoanaerobaculia bacterium]|nr:4-hydroxy-3-methylbut-2-enyl diphosphate reductase [Thermoanaerobaculia bacterium]
HSKNTKELVRIAEESKRTVFVGTAADLRAEDFAGVRKVGVTAGASTPDYDVDAVVERLRAMG